MLPNVAAHDLYVHVRHSGIKSNPLPLPSRELDRITRVCDHAQPQTQIIQGDAIPELIALALDFDTTEIPERLLDRIDANVDRACLSRQCHRERGFP